MKMLRDLSSLVGGRFIGNLIAILGFARLARVLTPTHYGYVEVATWIALLAAMVIDAGLGTIGTREVSQNPARAPELVATIPASQFLLALVVLPLAMLLPIVMRQPWECTLLIWIFLLGLITIPWKLDWLFQGLEMMKVAGYFYTFRTGIFTLGIFLFVRNDAHFISVGWIDFSAAIALTLYFVFLLERLVCPIRLRFSWSLSKTYLSQGIHLGLSNIIWTTIQAVPMMFLTSFSGKDETAWLAAPLRIVVSLLTFSWIYHYNLYPTLIREYENSTAAMNRLVAVSLRVVSWGAFSVTLLLALLANPLLAAIFGSKYREAVPIFSLLVWVIPITLVSGHFRWSLTAAGEYGCVLRSQILGLIAVLLAGGLMIPLMASLGAAMAMVVATAAICIASYLFSLLKFGADGFAGIVAVPAGLALFLFLGLSRFGFGPWINAAIGGSVFLLAGVIDRRLLRDLRILLKAKS